MTMITIPTQPMQDVILPPIEEGYQNVLEVVENDYHWYDQKNKDRAMVYTEVLRIARSHGLDIQVNHYSESLVWILSTDFAQRTRALLAPRFGKVDMPFVYPCKDQLGSTSFHLTGKYDWTLKPINHYSGKIPPRIFQILAAIDADRIRSLRYWIGEKRPLHPPPLWVGYALWAQAGLCFVALAEW